MDLRNVINNVSGIPRDSSIISSVRTTEVLVFSGNGAGDGLGV